MNRGSRRFSVTCGSVIVFLLVFVAVGRAQPSLNDTELRAAIDRLGAFDYGVRVEASRTVRRAPIKAAVPVLLETARGHHDSYVQFRAAVLLYGFSDARVGDYFREALASPNDRVRAAAYYYFEQEPDLALVVPLLSALDDETSEFVRPALVRALAAHDDSAVVRDRLAREIDRGEGYFRGVVIEALGDYRAAYAVGPLIRIAAEPGPLQDDAVLALGKIGDVRALPTLAALRDTAAEQLQPVVSAAACLLGTDCPDQVRYVIKAVNYGAATAGADQDVLRSASSALAALAMDGHAEALDALFDSGRKSAEPARAPIALALGTVALRSPSAVLAALRRRADLDPALLLLRDAFDMLDEDFAEERFYILMRTTYWNSTTGSRPRAIAEAAMQVLEF